MTAAGARSEQRGAGAPGEEAAAIAVVIGVAAIKLLADGFRVRSDTMTVVVAALHLLEGLQRKPGWPRAKTAAR